MIKLLKEFQVETEVIKKENFSEIYAEVEEMRLRGEEPDLQIHFGIEFYVDVINFSINFAAKNAQLMERINEHTVKKSCGNVFVINVKVVKSFHWKPVL